VPAASPNGKVAVLPIAVALALAIFSANPALSLLAIAVIPVLFRLLWRPGEPPVLLFAIGVQWLQVTMVLWYADFTGIGLLAAFGGPQLPLAVFLGLIGLTILAGGARLGMGESRLSDVRLVEEEAESANLTTLFILYSITFFLVSALLIVARSIPALTQLLIAAFSIKWMLLFALLYVGIHTLRGWSLMLAALSLEFLSGLLSYFSGFKSAFFVLIVVLLASRRRWRTSRRVLASVTAFFLILTSIVWSAVKSDYREFLNQGTESQTVLVPMTKRFNKLIDLVCDLGNDGMVSGFDALVMRVGYVTYFADTIENVPANVPYEDGRLWFGAVRHVLIPRLFNPSKPVIDDSERVRQYAGVQVAGAEQGTSISLGYITESYIDFGAYGMFIPIFCLGLLYGFLYRNFVRRCRSKILGFAGATSVLIFSASLLETSNIKLLGGVLTWAIVAGGFLWVAGPWLARIIGLRSPTISLSA
jgi:hypothetical protein